jgi:hypothetical protein
MQRGGGQPRFNGVAVGELSVDLLGPSIRVTGIYAFTNVETGERFGRGTKEGGWSEQTMTAFLAFLAAAENDICHDVFEEGSEPAPGSTVDVELAGDGVPGM